ncbi:MAG: efflux RND transporter periplasmic adaptor subunit [Gammaproteobacteria bacterium]|nr:efflux RND transporter periplasmic adaptor subunit [Gammaproteobacteria bacterium]
MNINKILLTGIAAVSIAVGIGAGWLLKESSQAAPAATNTAAAVKEEKKILFYRHPMNPSITSPTLQKDEMGMAYIPVYTEEEKKTEATGVVSIDPRIVQNLGARTAAVGRHRFAVPIDTVGTVAIDERGISFFNPKVSGWVERLHVRAVGDSVRRSQLLAEIYSPELVSAQEEFLVALHGAKRFNDSPLAKDSASLLETARARLRLLDVPDAEIQSLERGAVIRRTVKIHAPHAGTVTELTMREGGYVTPDTRLYSLADLSRVWVNVEIYASQLGRVKQGDPVTLHLAFMPGREWRGRIDYLYPTVNAQSRTVQARLVFDNPGGALRPGMYANATIQTSMRDNVLAVPREALLRTGTQEVVILALGEGRFKPVTVRAGTEDGGMVEILEGLEEGNQVVLSGQFLIDAEASFKSAMSRLEGGDTAVTAPAQGGHTGH